MKKLALLMIISLLSFPLFAKEDSHRQRLYNDIPSHPMHNQKIHPSQIQKRDFLSQETFEKKQKRHQRHTENRIERHHETRYSRTMGDERYFAPKPHLHKHHGYKYPKRKWEKAYRYSKMPFYDAYGYHYGYFDRRGYTFEGVFYRYDRYYTYSDRLRGRGLFDRYYYEPYRG